MTASDDDVKNFVTLHKIFNSGNYVEKLRKEFEYSGQINKFKFFRELSNKNCLNLFG